MSSVQSFSLRGLLAYITVMAAVLAGCIYARQKAIAIYGTPEALAQWNTWREAAGKQAEGIGPVKRRTPKSDKPPALVLMTDYFGICVGIALVLSSILFATTMILARGVMSSPGPKT